MRPKLILKVSSRNQQSAESLEQSYAMKLIDRNNSRKKLKKLNTQPK